MGGYDRNIHVDIDNGTSSDLFPSGISGSGFSFVSGPEQITANTNTHSFDLADSQGVTGQPGSVEYHIGDPSGAPLFFNFLFEEANQLGGSLPLTVSLTEIQQTGITWSASQSMSLDGTYNVKFTLR